MNKYDIYKDIAQRTSGDVYIGVVGPVRSGKSTFITRFMDEIVLPQIAESKRNVAVDELPQSAQGKTIMTTEPKFVPAEAAKITIDNMNANVRLIDCVGYLVDGAIGHVENDSPRLVNTPWSSEPMPFGEAAELGTKKVINEHSTIGIVVTTDGSFTEIQRESYVEAERRVVEELKILGKPFVVVLNTVDAKSKNVAEIKRKMEEEYCVPVIAANVKDMDKAGFTEVLARVLGEFPMCSFDIDLPEWMQALSVDNRLISGLIETIKQKSESVSSMRSFNVIEDLFNDNETFEACEDVSIDMANGRAKIKAKVKPDVFFNELSTECGEKIDSEFELMSYVKALSEAKRNYVKLKGALECAESSGYGVVSPIFDETELSEPEVVKRSGGYCVKMKAKAKSLHIIRADVETEVNPVSGNKKQCDDFVEFFSSCPESEKWNTEVFGRQLKAIVGDEVSVSSSNLCDTVKFKLRKTLNKAVNEKKNNLFCILI